jgi:hypothetical protein
MVTFLLHLNRLLPTCQISYKSKPQASLGLRRLQFFGFCRGTNASETARCQIQTRIGLLFGSVRMKQKAGASGNVPIDARPTTNNRGPKLLLCAFGAHHVTRQGAACPCGWSAVWQVRCFYVFASTALMVLACLALRPEHRLQWRSQRRLKSGLGGLGGFSLGQPCLCHNGCHM